MFPIRSFRIFPLLLLLSTSTFAADPNNATPTSETYYDPKTIQEIRLQIQPSDLDRLKQALPKRISVPATFRWQNQILTNAALQYKGSSSSAPNSPHKRSFLIDFGEFQDRQRFLGLRHVALDNGIQFGSLFSERLITDTLKSENVIAPHCNYTRLFLNDKNIGIYVNIERVDKSFLEHYFKSDRGPLLKVDEGGPGADLRLISDNPHAYQQTFELHAGKSADAYPPLHEFIRTINDPKTTAADIRRQFELDAFIKTTAVMLFAGAFDQYTGWNAHNYYLYKNPTDQRWNYIPWDLDVGFTERAFNKIPVLENWNAAWPTPVPDRPLMQRILNDPDLLQQYRREAKIILEKYFHPDVLIPKLRALHAQISADLKNDPFPPRRATVPTDTDYEGILTSMETFIRKRYRTAHAQLENPGPRPTIESANEEPKPGPPSPDAPTNLQATRITATEIELRWQDNAKGEFANIVQRAEGANSEKFHNIIGQPGDNITTAKDQNIQPGQTYRYRVYALHQTPEGPKGSGVSNTIEVHTPKN